MKNRYDDKLRLNNDAIISLSPANEVFRLIVAFESKKYYTKGMRVLEIGCGEGHSALTILEQTGATMDLLDISPSMIEESKKNLSAHIENVHFICSDALSYMETCEPYDIITSSWTIHNLKWPVKKALLEKIHAKLAPSGHFIFMDKVYPEKGARELLDIQLARYKYLPADVATEITSHEIQDMTDDFRIDEKTFLPLLSAIGFKGITIVDRVERDIVLIAHKA